MKITPNQTIKDFSYGRKFVRGLASRSIAPVILLEAFVEGGRTYQAYKRGGYTEARERLTEEMIGAAFWFSGVPLFNKLIDKYAGEKFFAIPDTDFDTGKDNLRNPVKNYINKYKSQFQKKLKNNPEGIEKMIAKYKFGKVLTSIVLANCLVGLVLPKVNQGITKHLMKKQQPKDNQQKSTTQYTMDKFLNKDKKNIAFGMSPQLMMSLAYSFENNPKYGLLSSDLGVWVGRGACARNKYERTEVLFRDISSSYFYMFNMPVIAFLLNKLQGNKSGKRLDPVAAKQVTDHLNQVLDIHGGKMKTEAFSQFVLGNSKNEAFLTLSIKEILDKNNGVMKLKEFVDLLPEVKEKYPEINIKKFTKAAQGMSELQPKLDGAKMISKKQILDIFTDGAINMPEFLKNVFRCATSDQNLFTGKVSESGFNKDFVFISQETFTKKQQEMIDYVQTIIKKAKGGEITKDLLKKASRENYIKNAENWGIGFAISAAFLSTFIPKIQYWITRKLTGSDAFPGTADYSK